jgi:hypothetical protein
MSWSEASTSICDGENTTVMPNVIGDSCCLESANVRIIETYHFKASNYSVNRSKPEDLCLRKREITRPKEAQLKPKNWLNIVTIGL